LWPTCRPLPVNSQMRAMASFVLYACVLERSGA